LAARYKDKLEEQIEQIKTLATRNEKKLEEEIEQLKLWFEKTNCESLAKN